MSSVLVQHHSIGDICWGGLPCLRFTFFHCQKRLMNFGHILSLLLLVVYSGAIVLVPWLPRLVIHLISSFLNQNR